MADFRLGPLLGNLLRVVVTGVIVTTILLVTWVKHPQQASSSEFLAGVSDGTITSADYDVDDHQGVHVRWRASDTVWREAEYSPEVSTGSENRVWDPVEELRADLRNRAPGPDPVALGTYQSMCTETAIDRLIVVTDVLYLPWIRLKWALLALGAVLTGVMLGRKPNYYERRIQWVALSLATGVGFLAYLWLEKPGKRAGVVRATAAQMRLDPVALGCLAVAGILIFAGV